jgi:hypothetical protein
LEKFLSFRSTPAKRNRICEQKFSSKALNCFIKAREYIPEVFNFIEKAFDKMSLFIAMFIVKSLFYPVLFGWDILATD